MAASQRNLGTLYLVFFFSGAAGLGYQVIWSKMFAATLGHELPAVLAVVSAFMSGMALGGFLFPKLPQRARWYVWLELLIGAWAVISTFIIAEFHRLAPGLIPLDISLARHWTIVFLFVLLTLLPATTALGATFPAMVALAGAAPRNKVALLYALNTGGAVGGALISAYLLMPRLGLRNSLLACAALSAVCAGVAGLWVAAPEPATSNTAEGEKKPSPLTRRFWATAFVTGLLGLGYEMAGIRILSHSLENTVFTFACALAIYLLGTAAGAAIWQIVSMRSKIHGERGFDRLLASLAVATVVCASAGLLTSKIYGALRAGLGSSAFAVLSSELLVAAIIFLVPTILMGAIFASLAEKAGRFPCALGRLVALNSLGAAIGPILCGAILYPLAGSKWTICLLSLGYAALLSPVSLVLGVAGCLSLIAYLLPQRLAPIDLREGQHLAAYREGAMASVAVLQETNSHRVLKVNNRFQMGGTAARIAEQRHADIPLLLHENPRRALFLGLGTGITFATARNYPNLQADGVELVPEIISVLPMFAEPDAPPNNGALLATHIADAQRFVRTVANLYDVVEADLFHPAQDGAGLLYSREHFQAIRQRLASGGVFCQWLPLYQLNERVLQMIVRTFVEVFPNAEGWLLRFNVDTPVLGLIAHESGRDQFHRRLALDPALAVHLKRVGLNDAVRLYGCFLAGPAELRRFVNGAPLNTDDNPRVIFEAPKSTYAYRPAYEILLKLLDTFKSDITQALPPGEEQRRVAEFIRARNIYLRGLALEEQAQVSSALDAYVESARISPDFTMGYAQCLTIATALARSNPGAAKTLLQRLNDARPERPVAKELLERL